MPTQIRNQCDACLASPCAVRGGKIGKRTGKPFGAPPVVNSDLPSRQSQPGTRLMLAGP